MDYASLLACKRQAIESALEACFASLPQEDPFQADFIEALRHAIQVGGKRVRPILTLLVAEACDCSKADEADALRAATAIELLHGYTLVHDDLPSMDNDTERRGFPTVWTKYDEGTAILVGDYLQALSFRQLAPCQTVAQLLPPFTDAATQVVHGQIADISAAKVDAQNWTPALLGYVFLNKTAILIATACRLGAIVAKAPREVQEAMFTYGTNVGLAFQYIDDLLDATQSQQGNELSALAVYDGEADAVRTTATYCTQQALKALRCLPEEKTVALRTFATDLLERLQ